jgi:signal transduction histidine kinase
MPSDRPPMLWHLIVMFATAMLSLLGVSGYAQYVQHRISRDAEEIASNASPSISHLTAARTELRHLEVLLTRAANGARTPAVFEAIARSRARIHTEIKVYLDLPAFSAERAIWTEVNGDLQALEQSIDRILIDWQAPDRRAPAGDPRLRELADAMDRVDEALARSIAFNAEEARLLAQSITATRRRAALVEGVLDGVSFLLALGSAALLLRAVRQYMAMQRAHNHLAEQRSEELEQFAGRVAHDILSPLSATGMALGIAAKALPADAAAQGPIARGARSLQRVQRIVTGLLEFARAGAQPEGARAEVGPIVDDVVSEAQSAAADEGIAIHAAKVPPCAVRASPGVLTSALANLVRNAVKYMGDAPERRIEVRVTDLGSSVRFEVMDTGPGIPENLHRSVFEPYVRATSSTKSGIGLGLATVRRIAVAHGGQVGLRSALGAGSTFWFELPKAEAEPDDARRASPGDAREAQHHTQ